MFPGRPGRIEGFNYLGLHRYFLTICTSHRTPFFSDPGLVESVLTLIRQCATTNQFSLLAYCFMPDHVHLLVEATSEHSDLQRFMARWKQLTGYCHMQGTGKRLWQDSYYDHVLRDDEETWRAARYVLENPVRKGLVVNFEDYPYCGSDTVTVEELKALWEISRQG